MKLAYRIRRGPFWIVFAVLILINIAMQATTGANGLPLVFLLVWLAVLAIIWLAVCVGRLRDMGKSPWLCLLTLVPLVGFFMLLWLGFSASESADTAESRN